MMDAMYSKGDYAVGVSVENGVLEGALITNRDMFRGPVPTSEPNKKRNGEEEKEKEEEK
jgi:hypothetical protein